MCLRDLFQILAQLKTLKYLTSILVHWVDVPRTVRPIHIVLPVPVVYHSRGQVCGDVYCFPYWSILCKHIEQVAIGTGAMLQNNAIWDKDHVVAMSGRGSCGQWKLRRIGIYISAYWENVYIVGCEPCSKFLSRYRS